MLKGTYNEEKDRVDSQDFDLGIGVFKDKRGLPCKWIYMLKFTFNNPLQSTNVACFQGI